MHDVNITSGAWSLPLEPVTKMTGGNAANFSREFPPLGAQPSTANGRVKIPSFKTNHRSSLDNAVNQSNTTAEHQPSRCNDATLNGNGGDRSSGHVNGHGQTSSRPSGRESKSSNGLINHSQESNGGIESLDCLPRNITLHPDNGLRSSKHKKKRSKPNRVEISRGPNSCSYNQFLEAGRMHILFIF